MEPSIRSIARRGLECEASPGAGNSDLEQRGLQLMRAFRQSSLRFEGERFPLRGTVRGDGLVLLEEPSALPPGQVQVVLRPVLHPQESGRTFLEVIEQIHQEQHQMGFRGSDRESIDARIAALREDDEERWMRIYAETGRRDPPGDDR